MANMRRRILTPGQEENKGQCAMGIPPAIDPCEATAGRIRHYVYIFKWWGTDVFDAG
jgi:hypothetical protein